MLAFACGILCYPELGERGLVLGLIAAVLATAWSGGFGPTLLATGLGLAGAAGVFFTIPDSPPEWVVLLDLGVLLLVGAACAVAVRSMQASAQRILKLQNDLGREREELADAIAQHLQAEERGAQHAAIIQSSDDAIIGMTLTGFIHSWNPGAERLFGYAAVEAIGQHIEILIPVDYSRATPELMDRISRGDHIKHYETVRLRKDGTLVDVSLGISPIKDGLDEVIGISTIARDIGERKQSERRQAAEHAIATVLARSTTLQEAAPKVLKALGEGLGWPMAVLWSTDRTTETLRCVEVWHAPMPRARELAGVMRETTLEHNRGLPGRAWAGAKPVWAPQWVSEETTPRAPAGSAAGLNAGFACPILFNREVLGVLEFLTDKDQEPGPQMLAMLTALTSQMAQFMQRKQTEQRLRQTEEQFRQAQKMEAIGRLAGGIAHDFNNLLTGILGYSDLILTGMEPTDPLHGEITEIRKAADRAALLTKQLLAFSRKQVLALKVLDLNAVLADTQKMLHRLIGEDIQLSTRFDPNLGKVKADPSQIQQVVINLAVNARDAMPSGGTLVIETANADVGDGHADLSAGRYIKLTVSDTGCGMDEATLARIFEPFFTTKEVGKGTGLGLATVYGIVKQSSGHIEVQSKPSQGTRFCIWLPRNEEILPLRKSHPGVRQAPRGQETLLLVEDEPIVRALASHTLKRCGYEVLEASCGDEAMRLAEEHEGPIHLLVSDVVMPGMGGRQLVEQLLLCRPDLKVLFMSGYTDDDILRHGALEAEVAFLHKPFTPVALADVVRQCLDRPSGARLEALCAG